MTRLRLCASYYPATFRANTQIGICNLGFAHRCVLLLWTQMVAPAGGFITTIKLYSFAWFCVCCVSLFVWCFTTTVYRILSAFHLTDVIGHIFFPVPSFIILPTGCRWKQLSKNAKISKKRKNLGQKWLSVENIRNVPSIIRQSEEMPIAWQRLCLRWSHYNYC